MTLSLFVKNHPRKTGVITAILASAVFGLYPATSRAVYADGGNAAAVILATAWARGLGLALYCLFARQRIFQTREDNKQAVIGGFFQACSNLGIFLALLYIPGPLVIIIVFTHTLMLLFYMAWRGEIKLDFLNIATTIVALLGLSFVLDIWHVQAKAHWIGMGLAFISALATVSRLYVYGHQTQVRPPIAVGAENLLVAAFLLLAVALFQAPHFPDTFMGNVYVAESCLSLTLGSFLMFWGISLLGSFQYSLMCKIEPVFTALFSVFLLNEVLGLYQYIGMALVLGSLAAYQIVCQKRRAKEDLLLS